MLLRVDCREKAGSVKIAGWGEGSTFEALVPAQTDRYPQPKALYLRALCIKIVGTWADLRETTRARERRWGSAGMNFDTQTEQHLLS